MIPSENTIKKILRNYQQSFISKAYGDENDDHDLLMDLFGILPATKRENRQYWGRELGMCWQLIVTELFRATVSEFDVGYREGDDELCDLIAAKDAIDTKYRIGSGDSGTLKKFKQYGKRLSEVGYRPVFLIVREDNLKAAMTACNVGGWSVYTGERTFEYITEKTGVDFRSWLLDNADEYHIAK